jgi:hypothetical protein
MVSEPRGSARGRSMSDGELLEVIGMIGDAEKDSKFCLDKTSWLLEILDWAAIVGISKIELRNPRRGENCK